MIPPAGEATVSVEVSNTGKVAGDEVVQLYVQHPKGNVPWPPRELCGFGRVSLKPGEKKTVTFTLKGEQLAYYDVVTHDFAFEPGKCELLVGSSSRDIRGKGTLDLKVPGT